MLIQRCMSGFLNIVERGQHRAMAPRFMYSLELKAQMGYSSKKCGHLWTPHFLLDLDGDG
jgi:hypothetical protein